MYQASCYHYDTRVLIYIMIGALRLRSFGFESAAEGYWQISLFRFRKLYYLREELLPWYPLGCRARRAGSVNGAACGPALRCPLTGWGQCAWHQAGQR